MGRDGGACGIAWKIRTEASSEARFALDLNSALRWNWKRAEIGLVGWDFPSAAMSLFSGVFALVFSISVCLD